ncbi:MAG: M50 family metallopeptidase [Calothrix sp. MO_167.B12]|nr:M50 family metallopeptidase [Calothrix sp. MO_167.B12]
MREPGKNFEFLHNNQAPPAIERTGFTWLIAAALVTVLLWQIPAGDYILYPFTILATWFHEMGHGLAAIILGGDFRQLQIYGNGSGVAFYSGRLYFGSIGRALVAAAGPMGPPIAGAGLILADRKLQTASFCLKILGSFLLFSVLIWVRSLFGIVAITLLGLVILGISLKAPKWMQGFAVQFLGVQACISTYHQLNYLFSSNAGSLGLSDTAQIQQQLFLPYWFWGGLMAIASLVILVQSLRIAYQSH